MATSFRVSTKWASAYDDWLAPLQIDTSVRYRDPQMLVVASDLADYPVTVFIPHDAVVNPLNIRDWLAENDIDGYRLFINLLYEQVSWKMHQTVRGLTFAFQSQSQAMYFRFRWQPSVAIAA